MKRYIKSTSIFAMATDKSKLLKRMEAWSDNIMLHLCKCAMYGDTLPGDKYNHWIEELAVWIFNTNDTVCKPNNKKLKPAQYESALFGWLSDASAEARSNLADLQLYNKKFGDKAYPYIKEDDAMIERMRKISAGVLETFVPILSSKNELIKQDIEAKLHDIIDPVCKQVN